MLGLAIAGLGALGKMTSGLFQGMKARRIERNNVRPIQQVQSEYFKNVADAEQMARIGMPQQQYNQGLQNIQRNQSGVLGALSRSANPNAGLQSLLRASNDATMNLDVQNALQRNQNRRGLMQQRGILAGQKQNAFDWNEKSKYLAKVAEAQALRGAGAQNLMGAFGDVTQIGMMADQQENGGGGMPNQLPQSRYSGYLAAGSAPRSNGLFNAQTRYNF